VRPIAPRIDGAEEETVGEDVEGSRPMVMAFSQWPDGTPVRISRWTMTDAERELIYFGKADVYLYQFADESQSVFLNVGPDEE
jgi:hypothetical protein